MRFFFNNSTPVFTQKAVLVSLVIFVHQSGFHPDGTVSSTKPTPVDIRGMAQPEAYLEESCMT